MSNKRGGYHIREKSKSKSGINDTNTLITANMIENFIEEKLTAVDFYELEPVEVLQVYKNSDDIGGDDGDYSFVGAIKGRYILSEQGLPLSKCGFFKPLNPNINAMPAKHELVLGIKMKILGGWQYFYLSAINVFGNPNFNQQPNTSNLSVQKSDLKMGDYLSKIDDFRKLEPYEGDVIIEGRYQNSIRLSSDLVNENEESPNIIFTAGHLINGDSETPQKDSPFGGGRREKPIVEDIDKDGSSIYLTTNQTLEFTPAVESLVEGAFGPFEGKNILLDSDRIIFNTKNNGSIAMMSSNNIALSSVTSVVIESPEVKVGSNDAGEQMVLGTTLIDRLIGLVDAIGKVSQIPTPTGPTLSPINTAAVGWSTPGGVEDAKGALIDALSELHRIDK